LSAEISHATTQRLEVLRAAVRAAVDDLSAAPRRPGPAGEALAGARAALEELLDRFRVIVRGVYPAVLRDLGPAAALEEVLADLPRAVRLTGGPGPRLGWEIESGIYYLTAAAATHLAGRSAHTELHLHLEHRDGRLSVRIDDPELGPGSAAALRTELAGDIERLTALGGAVEVTEYAAGTTVLAWLPDRLEPLVGSGAPA
jgi:signal transduction histidine kinase